MAQKWNPFSRIIGKKKEQINHNPYKEVIRDTQIFNKKVQKLLSEVELIGELNHQKPGKYNEASIEKLREQVGYVKNSIQNLKNSFGEQKKRARHPHKGFKSRQKGCASIKTRKQKSIFEILKQKNIFTRYERS